MYFIDLIHHEKECIQQWKVKYADKKPSDLIFYYLSLIALSKSFNLKPSTDNLKWISPSEMRFFYPHNINISQLFFSKFNSKHWCSIILKPVKLKAKQNWKQLQCNFLYLFNFSFSQVTNIQKHKTKRKLRLCT